MEDERTAEEKRMMDLMSALCDKLALVLDDGFREPMGFTLLVWPLSQGTTAAMVGGSAAPDEVRSVLEVALKAILTNQPGKVQH